MTKTISLWSPKGGQGVSTVAVGLAAAFQKHGSVQLVASDPGDLLSICGMYRGSSVHDTWEVDGSNLTISKVVFGDKYDYRIYDQGTDPDHHEDGLNLLVTKACYLSLSHFVAARSRMDFPRLDGVILIEEAGRTLREEDLAAITELPMVGKIPVEYAIGIMRAVDSGLLLHRVPQAFKRLAQDVEGFTSR